MPRALLDQVAPRVVAEMVLLAVAGPVLDHARLVAQGLPTVVAAQPQRVAVGHHQTVGVAEAAHGVAVAVDHRAQLAVFVVAVLGKRFHRFVVHHTFDAGQAPQRVVVVQVHAGTAGDSLQRHFAVGVRYFTEVEKEEEQAVAVLGV